MTPPDVPRQEREFSRRQFLGRSACQAATVAAGMATLAPAAQDGVQRVRLGIIGVRNRGRDLAGVFAANPRAEVRALCDVDPGVIGGAVSAVTAAGGPVPDVESDFRRLLDRTDLDAVVIATPDHWHASMTTQACAAGKDVYVEAPATWCLGEGLIPLAAAQRSHRIVQCGIQERSSDHVQSAVEYLRTGQLGNVRFARAWVVHRRKPIPPKSNATTPLGVDYASWLGPAVARPFNLNRYHFNWRWFWDYGGGELAHWGTHWLDIARWALDVEWPQRVSASGTIAGANDSAETPDTLTAQFVYPQATLVWEHRLSSGYGVEGRSTGVAFHGERGVLVLDRGGWRIYDGEPASSTGSASAMQQQHVDNFLTSVLTRQQPACDLWQGVVSAGLAHLGNIAYRVGREIQYDPVRGRCTNDEQATALVRGRQFV
ncbi:MAG TPA: Gfo/Idh/MocA family oxidoreductase [Planctomycetaceae bacterium]|nr:Gfo/Idh/MocA family oxidoreductase [Planctomycetaceae bacterium]